MHTRSAHSRVDELVPRGASAQIGNKRSGTSNTPTMAYSRSTEVDVEGDAGSSTRNRIGCQCLAWVMLAPPPSRLFLAPRHPIDRVERLPQLACGLRPVFWFLGEAGQHHAVERRRDRKLRSLRWRRRHSLQVLSNHP